MPGLTVHAPEVDDVAVIKAFPLLGMINELLDRRVVAFQRRGQEGVRLTIEVVRQPAAPQLARQARGERQEVVFGRDLVQGSQSPSVYRVDVAAVAGEPEDFLAAFLLIAGQPGEVEHTALGVGRMELRQRNPQLFGEDLLLVPVEPAVAVWPVPFGVQSRVQVEVLAAGHVERELEAVVVQLVAVPVPDGLTVGGLVRREQRAFGLVKVAAKWLRK